MSIAAVPSSSPWPEPPPPSLPLPWPAQSRQPPASRSPAQPQSRPASPLRPPSPPPWFDRVVAELRAHSGDLLLPGLAWSAGPGSGPGLQPLLRRADRFVALLPGLLADVADVLPVASARPDPSRDGPVAALRWLLHVCLALRRQLDGHAARFGERIAEALAARDGTGRWAQHDAQRLRELDEALHRRAALLRRAERDIRNGAGTCGAGAWLAPLARRPVDVPRTPDWQHVRRLALDEQGSAPDGAAEAPFLYQRWCGLKLLECIARDGWVSRGDPAGALLLGGSAGFDTAGGAVLTVWMEPRIGRATMERTGWTCGVHGAELTPDYLISCGPIGRRDAFVLDATLSGTHDTMRTKARKYRAEPGILGIDPRSVAGVPVPRRPLRTWTVAPLLQSRCTLGDPEGHTGIVPLHPSRPLLSALQDWVADVGAHARRLG